MRYPKKLALLPGLRWTGHLSIVGDEHGKYIVHFNAVNPSADALERHVYDRALLSAKQVRDWTGFGDDSAGVEP